MSDEEGAFFDDDDDEEEEIGQKKRKALGSSGSKSKKSKPDRTSLIDDAAEESGEEGGDDDEEEEDDENENDYVKDGFVVDEDEVEVRKRGDLEDSDDDDDDDDDDDGGGRRRKKGRVRKLRDMQMLDEDDLDLINEAQGIVKPRVEDLRARERQAERVRAHNEAELRKGLFHRAGGGVDSDDEEAARRKGPKKKKIERYDEDGMDDFIDDDIGDQHAIMAADGGEYQEGGISEAQLNEASEIFGTDYLDFMQEDEEQGEDDGFMGGSKYREQGVGVDYGEGEDDLDDESDDDLFGDDDDDGGDPQKAEALRLRREKRKLSKEERRRQAKLKKAQRQKAELRKNFEPVQLIENFCTEKDDEIRMKDAPERFYDWSTPFHGSTSEKITDDEEEEAMWIMSRIAQVSDEFFSTPVTADAAPSEEDGMTKHQKSVLASIVHALRFMHQDKLEPAFIKRYRADIVSSAAVRDNLHEIMDQDDEWERLSSKRTVVQELLSELTAAADGDEAKGAEETNVLKLRQELQTAQDRLDDVVKQEKHLKEQISALGGGGKSTNDDDDDDDDLFGKDDDDDEDGKDKEAKAKEKASLQSHLSTIEILLEDRADKVAQLSSTLKSAEARNTSSIESQGPALAIGKKMCRSQLWNTADYEQYSSSLTEEQHVDDMKKYLTLLREGNDSIRKKEAPGGDSDKGKDRKRSRSVNHDMYRSRVAEGLRTICYKFMLAPFRVGIKLEELSTKGSFSYDKVLPGDTTEDGVADPLNWVAPKVLDVAPLDFANEMIGTGELIQMASGDSPEENDPLGGCRFVAAIELAYEPRIRRYLRSMFRARAVLTTRPTKKGLDNIDAFHDFYGLHLIRHKPLKEHFPMDDAESAAQKAALTPDERREFEKEMKKRETESCLQYLRILEAEHLGYITVHVHMPYLRPGDDSWYKEPREIWSKRENQDMSVFVDELTKVCLPADGDTDAWNEERMKILKFALVKVMLPEFDREARRDLREASLKVGVLAAGENLKEMALEGPYRPVSLQSENRFLRPTTDLPIVGVCVAADGKDATYLASVTEFGELNDHLAIPSGQRVDDNKMKEKVIDFLVNSRPHAVVVGTSGGFASRMISRKLSELIHQAMDKWNTRLIQGEDEDEDEFEERKNSMKRGHAGDEFHDDSVQWKCNVDLVDDTVSQLFGRSVRGKKEFPEKEVNLKCAIAMARHAKDPLAELTYAYNVASDTGLFGTEMLFLNLHPMQRMLPKTRLLKQYERVLCEAVADVGVDVNLACSHDHLLGSLTFAAGLGPRKAANLKQNIVRIGGAVASRRALLAKRLMGPVVYNNAAPFLRIREIEQLANQFLHPLDDTRLHPDVYHRNNWAVKIAIDALERVEEDGDKDSFGVTALRDVMDNSDQEVERLFQATKEEWERHYGFSFDVAAWDPRVNVPSHMWRDKVEELDLDAFAAMNEQGGMGKWNTHLQMIKWEFRLPYADPRKPMQPLTGENLFKLLTGETDQSLRPGKEVTGKVTKNTDFGSRIKLEGDVPGFIPLRNLSDEHVETAEDIVTIGSVVTAVVTEVKKDHMCADLSLRMEDFRKPQSSWDRPPSLPLLDNYFDRTAARLIEQHKAKERETRLAALQLRIGTTKIGGDGEDGDVVRRSGRVTRRACAHPAFRNAKNDEVDRELREAGESMVGEALIRPSSKASDSLAIHWVVKPDCIKIIEVKEEEKDTDASIGNILKIKDETYESIDELLGRFIAPMNDNVEALTNHRKFLDMPEEDLDEKLKEMKRKAPSGVFYHVCWMEMHPGYASLRFILGSTPRHHPVGISPKGFTWGSKTYSSLDKLLNDFKRNPRGVSSSSNRSAASGASRSTMQSHVTDASGKPSRWGARPPPPPGPPQGRMPPPPPPPAIPATGGDGWGAPAAGGWGQPPRPPPPRPPPPVLPPPPTGFRPPPAGPPPNFPPPPTFQQPPPGPPPNFGQPPPPYHPPGPPTAAGYPPRQ